jgi:hypothetical protein
VTETVRRAPYGLSVLVALGWYAVVLAAVIVGEFQVAGEHSCVNASSWCFTPGQGMAIGLVLASPFLLGMVVGAFLLAIPIARLVPSAPLAGTLSALAAALLVTLVGGLILAAR